MEKAICGQCGRSSYQFTEALINGVSKTVCVVCAATQPKNTNEAASEPLKKING